MARPQNTRNKSKIGADTKDSKAKTSEAKAKQKGDFAAQAKFLKSAGKDMAALKAAAAAHKMRQQKLEEQRAKLESSIKAIEAQQKAEYKTGVAILRKLEAASKDLAKQASVQVPAGKMPPAPNYVARADALLVMIALVLTLIAKKLR